MEPKDRPSWGVAHILATGHDKATCDELHCSQMRATMAGIDADEAARKARKRAERLEAKAKAVWAEATALTAEVKAREAAGDRTWSRDDRAALAGQP